MCADFADSDQLRLVCPPTGHALPCLLHNVITAKAAIYSGGREFRGQLQIGQVFHRPPRGASSTPFLGMDFYTGGFSSLESRFCISGAFSGSGMSQSMQRNLRPPDFTSMNLLGLPHFEQVGGGVFLAMRRSRKFGREHKSLCHR
jgi:hypothetical protein